MLHIITLYCNGNHGKLHYNIKVMKIITETTFCNGNHVARYEIGNGNYVTT